MQASLHSSEAKQARAKLMYNTRRHHVPRGYHSRNGKHIRWSERMNAILQRVAKMRSRRNCGQTDLAVKHRALGPPTGRS